MRRAALVGARARGGRPALLLLLLALAAPHAAAHVNSPHVYLEEDIGPYRAFVIAHLPEAFPGDLDVQVRVEGLAAGDEIEVLLTGIPPDGEERAAPAFPAERSAIDPGHFTERVPMWTFGLWHVDVEIRGARGQGKTRFPVPARVAVPRRMDLTTSLILAGLGLLLFVSLFQMGRGIGRDAHRDESTAAAPGDVLRGRIFAGVIVLGFAVFLGFIGHFWWQSNQAYTAYSAPKLSSRLRVVNPPAVAGRPLQVQIDVRDAKNRPLSRVSPNHGKPMQAVVVRDPGASYLLHAHPELAGPGAFRFTFTPPEAGTYRVFGDVLRGSGEGETITAELEVGAGREPGSYAFSDPDDAHAFAPAFGDRSLADSVRDVGDGLRMRWIAPSVRPLEAGEFYLLEFALEHTDGRAASALEPYMGVAGHLLALRSDLDVFIHLYPKGTVAASTGAGDASVPALQGPVPPRATFPYGFPQPGSYRLWVQMKHEGVIRTGVFDVEVE